MKKVIIIGTGIGGLACGSLLAKKGYSVEIFDRNSFVGGRCSSFERDGFIIDRFVHAFPMGGRGPHSRIASEIGEHLEFIEKDPAALVITAWRGKTRRFNQKLDIKPLKARGLMALRMGVKPTNYAGVLKLFQTLLEADEKYIESRDWHTIKSFLSEFTDDEQIHRYMNMLSYMFFVLPYDMASAGEFIYCFKRMFNAAAFGYIKGSTGSIPEMYKRGVEKFGGRVILEEPVTGITVKKGAVAGIETEKGKYSADIVISNAGIQTTIDLVGKDNMPESYIEYAGRLKHSYSGTILRYGLSRKVLDIPFLVYIPDISAERMFSYLEEGGSPADTWIFMPVIDSWDSTLVPEGKQMLIAGTGGPSLPGQEVSKKISSLLEKRIFELYPEIESSIEWRDEVYPEHIRSVTGKEKFGEAIGLAQIPGQVGKDKPSHVLPVKGLFAVGADVAGRGIGTELAAESGRIVAESVSKSYPND